MTRIVIEIEGNEEKDQECHFCGGEGCDECAWTGENLYNDLDENEEDFIL